MSTTTVKTADFIMYFIGATPSKRESVNIVNNTTRDNAHNCSIAPKPTAIPPKHPINNIMIEIIPNLLNSKSEKTESVCIDVPYSFCIAEFFSCF